MSGSYPDVDFFLMVRPLTDPKNLRCRGGGVQGDRRLRRSRARAVCQLAPALPGARPSDDVDSDKCFTLSPFRRSALRSAAVLAFGHDVAMQSMQVAIDFVAPADMGLAG